MALTPDGVDARSARTYDDARCRRAVADDPTCAVAAAVVALDLCARRLDHDLGAWWLHDHAGRGRPHDDARRDDHRPSSTVVASVVTIAPVVTSIRAAVVAAVVPTIRAAVVPTIVPTIRAAVASAVVPTVRATVHVGVANFDSRALGLRGGGDADGARESERDEERSNRHA